MRLAVFGATGGLGRHVVREALARGHHVVGHARTPSKLGIEHERLTMVQGGLSDGASIAAAIEGADAVLSCVGHSKGEDPAVYGRGLQHIVDAMGTHGVKRLLAISGAGLLLEGDTSSIGRRLIIAALKLISPKVLAGKEHEWEVIRRSDLDWTLVRVGRMVDKPAKGEVSVDLKQVGGSPMVPYPDVAAWMVDHAGDDTYARQAPFVSGG